MEAYEIRRRARETLNGNWLPSVLVAFIAGIFGSLILKSSSSFNINIDQDVINRWFDEIPVIVTVYLAVVGSFASVLSFATFILGGVVQLGYAQYLLKQQDRAECDVKYLFSQFHRFGQGFLQMFLRGLYIFLWSLLFIIPGIVKAYSYAMTPFIMAENPNLTANEAISASKEMMYGHKLELFLLELSFIGWNLLSVLTLGIGTLFLNPYMNVSLAIFYRSISRPAYTVEVIEE